MSINSQNIKNTNIENLAYVEASKELSQRLEKSLSKLNIDIKSLENLIKDEIFEQKDDFIVLSEVCKNIIQVLSYRVKAENDLQNLEFKNYYIKTTKNIQYLNDLIEKNFKEFDIIGLNLDDIENNLKLLKNKLENNKSNQAKEINRKINELEGIYKTETNKKNQDIKKLESIVNKSIEYLMKNSELQVFKGFAEGLGINLNIKSEIIETKERVNKKNDKNINIKTKKTIDKFNKIIFIIILSAGGLGIKNHYNKQEETKKILEIQDNEEFKPLFKKDSLYKNEIKENKYITKAKELAISEYKMIEKIKEPYPYQFTNLLSEKLSEQGINPKNTNISFKGDGIEISFNLEGKKELIGIYYSEIDFTPKF